MCKIFDKLKKIKIIPVIVLEDIEDVSLLGKALYNSGLHCAEITFRSDIAKECIRILSEEYPEILIGAGTVLNVEQVRQTIEAGAKFIVSPGFNSKVVQYCVNHQIPVIPGCMTPTEIEMALAYGLNVIKFFPAENARGISMMKAISAPYKNIRFIPTGGISFKNLESYLQCDFVLACGGSFMVRQEYLREKDFNTIEKLCYKCVEMVQNL